MYTDVLLATDGSQCARAATDHAIDVATTHDATLHAIYVVETRIGYDSGVVDPDDVERELRARGDRVLEAVESTAGDRECDVRTALRRGVPEREIADYVDEHDVDLAVLGARGRSEFKTILLGSTSEAVLRETSIPVVVVTDGGVGDDPDA